MKILWISFLILLTLSCGISLPDSDQKNINSILGGHSIRLKSLKITAREDASFRVNCGGFSEFIIADERPMPTSPGWLNCANGFFTYSHDLGDGLQTVRFWLREDKEIVLADFFSIRKTIGLYLTSPNRNGAFYGSSNERFEDNYVHEFSNGNIVIVNGYDDSNAINAGAAYFYDANGVLIRSVFGQSDEDWFGCRGMDFNDNCDLSGVYGFDDQVVITSPLYDSEGGLDAGRVCSFNSQGVENWCFDGDDPSDLMGSSGVIELLSGAIAISSPLDIIGGVSAVGSVTILSLTGTVLASINPSSFGGSNDASDLFGFSGITQVTNGNIIIRSASDTIDGVNNVGSLSIVNHLGNSIAYVTPQTLGGDNDSNDFFGNGQFKELSNGSLLVQSNNEIVNGVTRAGSVGLLNSNGAPIAYLNPGVMGGTNDANDSFGNVGIKELTNGNIIIVSQDDDVGGVIDVGSVSMINSSGLIMAYLTPLSFGGSNDRGDHFGGSGLIESDLFNGEGVLELSNGNIIISSPEEELAGLVNVGSLSIIDSVGNPIDYNAI